MSCSKRIIFWPIAAIVFFSSMHFLWIYCLPVPESNQSKSQLFSIKPGMSANQVLSILGEPKSVKVFSSSAHGTKATVFFDDFVEITNKSTKCTWLFSSQNYFKKTLEIYINFVDKSVARIAVERDDLAVYYYESGNSKPYIKNEKLLSMYLNP